MGKTQLHYLSSQLQEQESWLVSPLTPHRLCWSKRCRLQYTASPPCTFSLWETSGGRFLKLCRGLKTARNAWEDFQNLKWAMEVRKQIYFHAYTNPSSVLRHLWRPNLLQLHILATPHPGFIRLFWEKRYHSVFTFTIAPGGLRGILSLLPERKLLLANSCCAIVPCAIGTQHCLDHSQKKGFVWGREKENVLY